MAVALGLLSSVSAAPSCGSDIPGRPVVIPHPFNSGKEMPISPPRDVDRYCHIRPGCGEDRDDAPQILHAIKKCNNGGTVVFDQKYQIKSRLDLTFLKHIDIVVTGEIHFTDDVYHWADESFKYDYQNQSVFWKWGGEDVNIYGDLGNGKSVINGHGQAFWKEGFINKTVCHHIP